MKQINSCIYFTCFIRYIKKELIEKVEDKNGSKTALEEVLDFVIKDHRTNQVISLLCWMVTVPEYIS
jgi:fructose-1,6-bisphosphatase